MVDAGVAGPIVDPVAVVHEGTADPKGDDRGPVRFNVLLEIFTGELDDVVDLELLAATLALAGHGLAYVRVGVGGTQPVLRRVLQSHFVVAAGNAVVPARRAVEQLLRAVGHQEPGLDAAVRVDERRCSNGPARAAGPLVHHRADRVRQPPVLVDDFIARFHLNRRLVLDHELAARVLVHVVRGHGARNAHSQLRVAVLRRERVRHIVASVGVIVVLLDHLPVLSEIHVPGGERLLVGVPHAHDRGELLVGEDVFDFLLGVECPAAARGKLPGYRPQLPEQHPLDILASVDAVELPPSADARPHRALYHLQVEVLRLGSKLNEVRDGFIDVLFRLKPQWGNPTMEKAGLALLDRQQLFLLRLLSAV
ncbi:uncharacterized protein BcabD6B2_29720 [Babesia caballi]|uniref:Uncharacterized protein n=1 Tax=Babesia caballi TaxID=5871 RepID=A0AAV4LVA7_BABCB|nr:hypothetical protein BcabD6B2_29720 [Babesia caballi]